MKGSPIDDAGYFGEEREIKATDSMIRPIVGDGWFNVALKRFFENGKINNSSRSLGALDRFFLHKSPAHTGIGRPWGIPRCVRGDA